MRDLASPPPPALRPRPGLADDGGGTVSADATAGSLVTVAEDALGLGRGGRALQGGVSFEGG
eukprot:gene16051-5255_t